MPSLPRLAAPLALAAALHLPALHAEEQPRYNQVGLHAEVSQEVAHDRMRIVLYSEAQQADPAQLAALTTERLNRAVQRARGAKAVEVSLGSRQSFPVYDDKGRKVVAWRERAELQLESADFTALARLGSELLGELQIAGMQFSVSTANRRQHEDQLLKDAVDAFRARAQLVSQAMGASGYRLVRLDLNAGGPPRAPLRMAAMKSLALADAAPPQQIEAGSSTLTVSADGVIELQQP